METENELQIAYREPYLPALIQKKRYYLICGGRAGGRSFFASQYATGKLINTSEYFRCAIMRYVQGDIRNSIFQEIKDRIEEYNLQDMVTVKDSLVISFKGNRINGIGFRKSSSDQKAKLKSLAGYTDVIIEEAEEVSEEDFNQLDDSLRTIRADIRITLLFNLPPKAHWINKRFFNLIESGVEGFYTPVLKKEMEETTCYIHTTYENNLKNLNKTTIANFLNYKNTNPDHFYNMIMGLVPSGKRGLIYKNWKPISDKEFDELDYPVIYGLDFGFSNDQCALVEVKMHNDNIYVRELIYELGLLNKFLSEKMVVIGVNKGREIIADSAEPKSIAELSDYGWYVKPAEKGTGSRKSGVSYILTKNVYYTESSKNLIQEKENYCWALDKQKNPTNEPADGNDNLLDAMRYAVVYGKKDKMIGFY